MLAARFWTITDGIRSLSRCRPFISERFFSSSPKMPSAEQLTSFSDYDTYTDEFLTDRGKKVYCYYWEPKEKPRAMLFISHGFTDHTMMYEQLAQEMAKRRFYVFAHDHVGHGRSEGRRADVPNVYQLALDATIHIKMVQKKFSNLPLFIFGHSMGGAIALYVGLERTRNLRGVVALAPVLAPNPETATLFRVTVAKLLRSIVPHVPLAYADISLSCRNKTQIDRLNADPLRHHGYFTARSAASLLCAGEDLLKKKQLVDFPYLLLQGDEDKVCHISGAEQLHESSSSKDKTFVVYPGAYHSLFHEPENVASDVLKRTVQWLEERS